MLTIPNSDITVSVKDAVWWTDKSAIIAENLDPVLIKHDEFIESFGYVTNDMMDNPGMSKD